MTKFALGQKWFFENINSNLGPSVYEVIKDRGSDAFTLDKVSGSDRYLKQWPLCNFDINRIGKYHKFYLLSAPEPFTDKEYQDFFV